MANKINNISGKKFGKLTVLEEYRTVNSGKSTKIEWNCKCDCGDNLWVKSHSLLRGSTESCGCSRVENIAGEVFGRLTVSSQYRIQNSGKKSRAEWMCNCSCGNNVWVKTNSLKNGNTQSCGCFRLEKSRKEYGESSKNRVLRRYKNDAKKRGYEFSITKESFLEITSKNCSYCNEPPSNIQNDGESYGEFIYTGIDRLDNKKGYIEGNCIPCCRICNMAKGEMSREDFLTHISKIYYNILDFQTYVLYIGRYQSPHMGHMTIFNDSLAKGKKICIAIRNVITDEKNPLTATQVKSLWEKVYKDNDNVKIIIIPDIESVKYGRGVGYSVEEIIVSGDIANISATEIRRQVRSGELDWKQMVDEKIHEDIKELLGE